MAAFTSNIDTQNPNLYGTDSSPPNAEYDNKIIIDDYEFSLLYKINTRSGYKVKIESTLVNPNIIDPENADLQGIYFLVYQSSSELGMWRFCTLYSGNILYKGIDYIQTTLIHLKLQEHINKNFQYIKFVNNEELIEYENMIDTQGKTNIKITGLAYNVYNCGPIDDYKNIKIQLNNERSTTLEPFNSFEKAVPCGEARSDIYEKLIELSEGLKSEYDIGPIEEIVEEYSNIFQEIIDIRGKIKRVSLIKKYISTPGPSDVLYLYFLEATLRELPRSSPMIPPWLTDIIKQRKLIERNISAACSIPIHYMPFLLTPYETKVNFMGLYDKYISSGAYICKLFDYSSIDYVQCGVEEIEKGRCTSKYTYIGYRYSGIFPFNQIDEINKSITQEKKAIIEDSELCQFRYFGGRRNNKKKTNKRRKKKTKSRRSRK